MNRARFLRGLFSGLICAPAAVAAVSVPTPKVSTIKVQFDEKHFAKTLEAYVRRAVQKQMHQSLRADGLVT